MNTITYAITEETYTLPNEYENNSRRSYGIAAYADTDSVGTATILLSLSVFLIFVNIDIFHGVGIVVHLSGNLQAVGLANGCIGSDYLDKIRITIYFIIQPAGNRNPTVAHLLLQIDVDVFEGSDVVEPDNFHKAVYTDEVYTKVLHCLEGEKSVRSITTKTREFENKNELDTVSV